jgi:transposase-like protein
MKPVLNHHFQSELYPVANDSRLATTYPQLYCPRCGSYEIGLRKLLASEAVWGCKECSSEFILDFPGHRRF